MPRGAAGGAVPACASSTASASSAASCRSIGIEIASIGSASEARTVSPSNGSGTDSTRNCCA